MNFRRRFFRSFLPVLTGICAFLASAVVIFVFGVLLTKGMAALDWEFLSTETLESGARGGIAYQILGTLILISTALMVAAPPAIALALMKVVYLERHARFARTLEFFLQLLNGVPSIVFGILGLLIFLKMFGWGKSWLAGGIVLGFMIMPTVAISLLERLAAVPRKYIEAATCLGLTRQQVILSVWLPQSWTGLLTGSLLGLARASGETAPILFVAAIFAGARLPAGIRESPVLALPYHIFVLAQDTFNEQARTNLWGAALILVSLVTLLNLLALPLRSKLHEEANHV